MNFSKFLRAALLHESNVGIDGNQIMFMDILRRIIDDNSEAIDEKLKHVLFYDPVHSLSECSQTFHKMFRQTDVCSTANQDLNIWDLLMRVQRWNYLFKFMYDNKLEISKNVDKVIGDFHMTY